MTLEEKMKKFERICYKPITEETSDLNYAGSKYYGNPWIANGDKWPTNSRGVYYSFIYQLDVASLPEEYKNKLGGKGVVQFFYDMSSYGEGEDEGSKFGELVRLVYPNENGFYVKQPINEKEDYNYLIKDEDRLKSIMITAWESVIEYPYTSDEFIGSEKEKEFEDIMFSEEYEENIDKYPHHLGDKLGGYAFFGQAGYDSSNLLYQIDFLGDEEGHGVFKSYATSLIASDGSGLLFYDKDDGFSFDWACG